MMTILKNSVPDVKEYIFWSMPYYESVGNTISFSACKNHISLYAGEETIEEFALDLEGFTAKKNAIYFPYEKELPATLIERIAKWCLK